MRKTIIFGAFASFIGLAAVAQANDRAQPGPQGAATHEAVNDDRGVKHDRDARNERDDETGHDIAEAREGHEAAEHRDRD